MKNIYIYICVVIYVICVHMLKLCLLLYARRAAPRQAIVSLETSSAQGNQKNTSKIPQLSFQNEATMAVGRRFCWKMLPAVEKQHIL